MPKTAIDYQKTIIYKICCKDPTILNTYTGSTSNFYKRKQQHKSNCYNIKDKKYNYYVYKFIRENGGWENFEMLQIEEYPCNTKNEAALRERYWLEANNSNLNKHVPSRTSLEWQKEWRKNHPEEKKQSNAEWRKANPDYMKEYRKRIALKNGYNTD